MLHHFPPCQKMYATGWKHNVDVLPLYQLKPRPSTVRILRVCVCCNVVVALILLTFYSCILAPSPVAPKAALSAWYGTKPRAHQLSKHNYVSWNNRALPHLLKYTSIFVCPLSGEAFWSGKCGSVDSYEERNDINGNAVVWYSEYNDDAM